MEWREVYSIVVPLLAASFLVRVVLFLLLRPNDALEWATTLSAAGTFAFFAVLAYWLHSWLIYPPPHIYPPLVIAAILAMVSSVTFTVIAVQAWREQRKP
jgi:hypothetical protein